MAFPGIIDGREISADRPISRTLETVLARNRSLKGEEIYLRIFTRFIFAAGSRSYGFKNEILKRVQNDNHEIAAIR